jgi:hypothetical protein
MSVIDTLVNDSYLAQAIQEIRNSYNVEVALKGKILRKFGRNLSLGANTLSTVGTFQGNAANETFATGNTIDRVISDDAADAGKQVTIEGQTVDTASGNMTFLVQTAILGEQTAVNLTTPLFRATRLFGSGGTFAAPQGALAGNIAVYDNAASGGLADFLPSTAAATKLFIAAGQQQSTKAASSISALDYYIITSAKLNIDRTSGGTVTASGDVYWRQLGNEFRPLGLEFQARTSGNGSDTHNEKPYSIIPSNSDFRLMVQSATASTIASGHVGGYLARVRF